jgi:hypothetical protein
MMPDSKSKFRVTVFKIFQKIKLHSNEDDNIEMSLQEMVWGGMDCVDLAQNSDRL